MDETNEKTPYQDLTPDAILDAVESVGYRCDGVLLALNSYENRVYQVGIEGNKPLVVKFYRAGRWSDHAILEEHRFCQELLALELPVIVPLANPDNQTLHHYQSYRLSLYPRQGGRAPELENLNNLEQLGRFLGRIHAMGAVQPFQDRFTLDRDSYGVQPVHYLLESSFIPSNLIHPYQTLTKDLLQQVQHCFQRTAGFRSIRLHGDCHPGNILWTPTGPFFVDFDDACMGPAIQDLWMCLSGERADQVRQLSHLLRGYEQFFEFNYMELHLIEALRTLRMLHHSAWIARRWDDPAFPRAFPWFNAPRYWEEHLLSLREQSALMNETPLALTL